MNLLIYDEHPAILDGLKYFFNEKKDIILIGAFYDKNIFIDFLKNNKVDLIITDYLSTDELGFTWIDQIKKITQTAKIIVYSSTHNPLEINSFEHCGIDAYINKKMPIHCIHDTLLKTSQIPNNENKAFQKSKSLTKKEISIVKLMADGFTSHDIAKTMECSANTINNQKNHIIKKFGCKTSAELMIKLCRLGFIKI